MATKYQIEVQRTGKSRPIPRSGLYRSLLEAQAAAADDTRQATLVLITRLSAGAAPEQWHFCNRAGQWQPGRPQQMLGAAA